MGRGRKRAEEGNHTSVGGNGSCNSSSGVRSPRHANRTRRSARRRELAVRIDIADDAANIGSTGSPSRANVAEVPDEQPVGNVYSRGRRTAVVDGRVPGQEAVKTKGRCEGADGDCRIR